MKYWKSDNWKEGFDHEGLLFFVQRMQEMLFHCSSDIHRTPVHNTASLLQEYMSTYRQVRKGEISSHQLTQILDELRQMFSTDCVLEDNIGKDMMDILSQQLRECTDDSSYNLVEYICRIVEPMYLTWSVNYIKKHISRANHKIEIEKGIRCWLPGIIMKGYSAEFVYNYVEESLVKSSISSLTDIDKFFDRFDFVERKYRVYMQIQNTMRTCIPMLEKRLSLIFSDDGNFNQIKLKKNKLLCYFEIEDYDDYAAVTAAYHRINVFLKYYRFVSDSREYLLYKFGAVLDCETNQMHFIPVIPTGFKTIENHRDDAHIQMIDRIILDIQGSRDGVVKLNKAIELHNSAIRQYLPKDGFVNLWSILEVLCPQGNAQSKIEPILQAILPIMQNDYFTTIFQTIETDLEDNLSEKDYQMLLETVSGSSKLIKIASFCLLPEYENLREKYFFEIMSKLPLLRQKIYNLYKLKDNKEKFYALSEKYRQRVKWHMYRLYRARNSIVHAGADPNRIKTLGEHLHSYVDGVMFEIAGKMGRRKAIVTIDNLFIDTKLLVKMKRRVFAQKSAITQEDIYLLFEHFFIEDNLDT